MTNEALPDRRADRDDASLGAARPNGSSMAVDEISRFMNPGTAAALFLATAIAEIVGDVTVAEALGSIGQIGGKQNGRSDTTH